MGFDENIDIAKIYNCEKRYLTYQDIKKWFTLNIFSMI